MDAVVVSGLILLAHLGILGLVVKLYTEILKDASMNRRAKERSQP